jgi:hypothetical protein
MAKLLFRLNHVPETEADAVRNLLRENDIEFYETNAGRWGFSVAAIWLQHDAEFVQARELIEVFQVEHQKQSRAQFELDKAEGRIPTFWQLIRSNPILYVSYVGLIIVVAALTILPIFAFWK